MLVVGLRVLPILLLTKLEVDAMAPIRTRMAPNAMAHAIHFHDGRVSVAIDIAPQGSPYSRPCSGPSNMFCLFRGLHSIDGIPVMLKRC